MTEKKARRTTLARLNHYVQTLCGLYSRVARKLGVDRSYVSRVARGERRSAEVEEALSAEFKDFKRSSH